MASEEFEWFTRHLFLLSVGGRHALIGILNREVNNRSESLAEILLQNRDEFNSLSRDQLQRLFPTNVTVNDDIATWDLLLLISVVLELFKKSMSSKERFAINMLKVFRKKIKKRPNEICLSEADYEIQRTDLNNALLVLIENLDFDRQLEVKSDINISCTTNLESALQQIRELREFPDDFLTPLEERLQEAYPGCTGTRQRLDLSAGPNTDANPDVICSEQKKCKEDKTLYERTYPLEDNAKSSPDLRGSAKNVSKADQKNKMVKSWILVRREGHEPTTTDEDSSLSFTMIESSENESNNVGAHEEEKVQPSPLNGTGTTSNTDAYDLVPEEELIVGGPSHEHDETQLKGLVHLNEAEKAYVTAHEEENVQPSPLNGTGTTSNTEPEREETEPAALPLNDTGTSNITDASNLEPEEIIPIGDVAPTNFQNASDLVPEEELIVAVQAHEYDDIGTDFFEDLGVVLIETPHNETTPNIPEGDASTYPPLSRDDQIRLNNVSDQLRELNNLTSGVHCRSAILHTLILQINIKSDTARNAAQANASVVMAINQIITNINLLPLVRSSEAQQEHPFAIENNERNANLLGTENNEGNMERNTEQRILDVFRRRGELFQLIESILPLLLELLRLGGIPMSAGEGSVLFEIRCISYLGVTNLLQFITSERLQSILNDIAMVWERQMGHKVRLSPLISEESLRSLERFIAEEFNKLPTSRNLHLHLKHGGILYLKRLNEFLQSRSAEEVLNKIAEALANLHGGTYSISVNFEHHRQALDMVDTRAWHLAESFQF